MNVSARLSICSSILWWLRTASQCWMSWSIGAGVYWWRVVRDGLLSSGGHRAVSSVRIGGIWIVGVAGWAALPVGVIHRETGGGRVAAGRRVDGAVGRGR